MTWIEEWISGEPTRQANWIDSYSKADGTQVESHMRSIADGNPANNLETDYDSDGVPGFFDSDSNGDGVSEVADLNLDGIADLINIDIDGDGVVDVLVNLLQ